MISARLVLKGRRGRRRVFFYGCQTECRLQVSLSNSQAESQRWLKIVFQSTCINSPSPPQKKETLGLFSKKYFPKIRRQPKSVQAETKFIHPFQKVKQGGKRGVSVIRWSVNLSAPVCHQRRGGGGGGRGGDGAWNSRHSHTRTFPCCIVLIVVEGGAHFNTPHILLFLFLFHARVNNTTVAHLRLLFRVRIPCANTAASYLQTSIAQKKIFWPVSQNKCFFWGSRWMQSTNCPIHSLSHPLFLPLAQTAPVGRSNQP